MLPMLASAPLQQAIHMRYHWCPSNTDLAVALGSPCAHFCALLQQAIKALTAALAPKARAFRDGKLEQIDASGLVPGDVILMAIGNVVPADVKLMGEEGDDVPMQVTFRA